MGKYRDVAENAAFNYLLRAFKQKKTMEALPAASEVVQPYHAR